MEESRPKLSDEQIDSLLGLLWDNTQLVNFAWQSFRVARVNYSSVCNAPGGVYIKPEVIDSLHQARVDALTSFNSLIDRSPLDRSYTSSPF